MKIEEAKTIISQLLDSVAVKSVYYIDDYMSFDGLAAIAKYIEETDTDNLSMHSALIPDDIVQAKIANPNAVVVMIQNWWQGLSNKEQESVIHKCCPNSFSKSEQKAQSLFGDICVLCSPDEWEKQYSGECLNNIHNGEKSLLLFDQKLGTNTTAEGEGRTGYSLAQKFSTQEGVMQNTYCGIFSQSFGIEKEFEFRCHNLNEIKSWAFPLSKKRLTNDEDYTLFIEGLNNLFWVGHVDKLACLAQNIIKTTSNKLLEKFGMILPLDFKQLIIDSSAAEGCREVDTLLRLIHIIFSRELQRALSDNSDNSDNLNLINTHAKHIKDIGTVTAKPLKRLGRRFDENLVNSFFQDENWVPKDVVNNLLSPLQNGDVFRVNQDDYYVLLCQPCNIAVRNNGRRSTDIGYFVPLAESATEESLMNKLNCLKQNMKNEERESAIDNFKEELHKKLQEAAQGFSYPVKCLIEGKNRYAMINRNRTISLSILDYCTFSESGQVIVNNEYSPNLHTNQELLCNKHSEHFRKVLELDYLVEDLGEECRAAVQPKIQNWFYAFLTKLGVKSEFKNNRYVFPIRRIGHIQDPLASDLLTRLSHYLSRAGLPSEFDR